MRSARPATRANDILNCKIAEYSKAVVSGRPCFHISLVIDVSPNCDCHSENDIPIVPDVGMFASFDPVAPGCGLRGRGQPPARDQRKPAGPHAPMCTHDHFIDSAPETNWHACIDHAVKIGLGSDQYELIEI